MRGVSNEVLVGNKNGETKAWAVRRRTREERWCNKSVAELGGIPSDWKRDVEVGDQEVEILEAAPDTEMRGYPEAEGSGQRKASKLDLR